MNLEHLIEGFFAFLVALSGVASIVVQFLSEEQLKTPVGLFVYHLAHMRPASHVGTFKLPGEGPHDPAVEAEELEARLAELRSVAARAHEAVDATGDTGVTNTASTTTPPVPPRDGQLGRASVLVVVLVIGLVFGASTVLHCKSFPSMRGTADGCTPHEFRCVSDHPEVCSPDGYWTRMGSVNCADLHETCQIHNGVSGCFVEAIDAGTDIDAALPPIGPTDAGAVVLDSDAEVMGHE